MPARKLGTTTVTTTKTVQKGVEGIDCVNACPHLGHACTTIMRVSNISLFATGGLRTQRKCREGAPHALGSRLHYAEMSPAEQPRCHAPRL